jgi:hypothetical protein
MSAKAAKREARAGSIIGFESALAFSQISRNPKFSNLKIYARLQSIIFMD